MIDTFDLIFFAVVPFVIGAIIHFTSEWFSIPATLVLSLLWLGCCYSIGSRR